MFAAVHESGGMRSSRLNRQKKAVDPSCSASAAERIKQQQRIMLRHNHEPFFNSIGPTRTSRRPAFVPQSGKKRTCLRWLHVVGANFVAPTSFETLFGSLERRQSG